MLGVSDMLPLLFRILLLFSPSDIVEELMVDAARDVEDVLMLARRLSDNIRSKSRSA